MEGKISMNVKLNVGCGPDLKPGYINIDRDDKEEIQRRYGIDEEFQTGEIVYNFDVFDLPFLMHSVDEILCEGFLEHLSFSDESKFFKEVVRVLKPGGLLEFTVPDFDSICKQWLEAEDDFKDWYKLGEREHWFGQGDRSIKNKWGFLTAAIFGNQNGEGQYHLNAYTAKKIMKIMNMLGFSYQLEFYNFKTTDIKMIRCKARKL
jgi:predicted SAM-dependent methyltransferase